MDTSEQELTKFWTYAFGKDGVEFAHAIFGDLVVYRRLGWNMRDNEWNIDAIPSIPDLNLIYQFAIPKLQKEGYWIQFLAFENNGFRTTISGSTKSGFFPIIVESDSPTEALYNAIMKVIDNEVK